MLWEPCGVRWQCIWAGFLSVTECVRLILCRIHMYNISLFHILMSFCFWKFYRLLTVVCIQKTEVHCSISRNDAVSPDTRDCVACSGSGLPGTPPSPPSQCTDTFKKIIASGLEGLAHCWTAEWAMMYIAFLLASVFKSGSLSARCKGREPSCLGWRPQGICVPLTHWNRQCWIGFLYTQI